MSVLTEKEVLEMRMLKFEKGWTYSQVGEEFGVCLAAAFNACNGVTWRRV